MQKSLKLTLFLFIFSCFTQLAAAGGLTLTTYYPPPSGAFSEILLPPMTDDLPTPCTLGKVVTDKNGQFRHCHTNLSGNPEWKDLEIWSQVKDATTNDVYPKDYIDPNLMIGIATNTPRMLFDLGDTGGGILATGATATADSLDINNPGLGASIFFWNPLKAAFRAGAVDDDYWDDSKVGDYSVSFGRNNEATGDYSMIAGGGPEPTLFFTMLGQTASGNFSFIGGGSNNIASGNYSAILGGGYPLPASTPSREDGNIAQGDYSVIASGLKNEATAISAGFLSGENNTAGGLNSVIVGGKQNETSAEGAAVLAGTNNTGRGNYAFVGAGSGNHVGGLASVPATLVNSAIVGGNANDIYNPYSVSLGGKDHDISADRAVFLSGKKNYTTTGSTDSIIIGGECNYIANTATRNVIMNTASGPCAWPANAIDIDQNSSMNTVISSDTSLIADQCTNTTIIGGGNNLINSNSDGNVILHGSNNIIASGQDNNFLLGTNNATINGSNNFVWGKFGAATAINASDSFLISTGRVGIGLTTTPQNELEITNATSTGTTRTDGLIVEDEAGNILMGTATAIGSNFIELPGGHYADATGWQIASSRDYKKDIAPLSSDEAKDVIRQLQPVSFRFKAQQDDDLQLGFIAEDVPELVAKTDRKAVNPMDIVAVLTSVAQQQQQQIETYNTRLNEQQKEINALKKMIGKAQRLK